MEKNPSLLSAILEIFFLGSNATAFCLFTLEPEDDGPISLADLDDWIVSVFEGPCLLRYRGKSILLLSTGNAALGAIGKDGGGRIDFTSSMDGTIR